MNHSGKLRNMASVYFTRGHEILLLYRQGKSIVSNMWIGSAGGHFEFEELNDAKACVLRELKEELGLTAASLENLSLRYITLRYTDHEIRQNYYFFANLTDKFAAAPESTEGITQWQSINSLDDLPMPFTARHMIDHYISIGQFDDALYGGLANQNAVVFEKL